MDDTSAEAMRRAVERLSGAKFQTFEQRKQAALKAQLEHDGIEYVPPPSDEELQKARDEAVADRAAEILKERIAGGG